MVNSLSTRGFIIKFTSGATASDDYFQIKKIDDVSGPFLDYNYTNNNCVTINKKLFIQGSDLQMSDSSKYIYSGNWRYRNGAFYSSVNDFYFNMNELSRVCEITNGALVITSAGLSYNAEFSAYGYLNSTGNTGYNSGTNGLQTYSIISD